MIDQEHPELNINLQKYGCYFFSIAWLCSKAGCKVPVLPKEWNDARSNLLGNGIKDVAKDMTIEDGSAVFRYFGLKVKQVMGKDGSVACSPDTIIPGSFEVLCYTWPEKGYTHFMAGDGHGRIAYDPIHRGSNTAKYGKLTSKRLYILEE